MLRRPAYPSFQDKIPDASEASANAATSALPGSIARERQGLKRYHPRPLVTPPQPLRRGLINLVRQSSSRQSGSFPRQPAQNQAADAVRSGRQDQ